MVNEKQRIELHCHSKFGGNSTMYPGEIVRYLSENGMPAFAITDESNINAYPELEMVWETGKYLSRPIFGMEIMVEGVKCGEVDHLSVLIKNETGKKALYHIITESESEEPHPIFQLKAFLENREGFLLGSGTEKGRLYKMVFAGMNDEALKEEIKQYDYIELLPCKEYEGYNKRIVTLCEALNIPAVAVSDARYLDKVGREALKIMKRWNMESETFLDNHFWSTGEMLKAFDYLPEDKAYEIVVENTHLLADMCETFSICPKEKCFPKVVNAGARLREKCYEVLKEKYAEGQGVARDRLDWELAAIEKTEMESCLLQIQELLIKSNLKTDDISMRGTAIGSIVAYLLGISNIDPLKYGLEPEMIFGANGQRLIDIDLNLPTGSQLDVIKRVGSLEGVSKCVWAGTINCISDSLAQAMIEKYMYDSGHYYEEGVFDRLRWLIAGNYMERGKHPGGVVIFPDGCEYMDMLPITKVAGGFEITYFDYHSIDDAFMKYDLLKHDSPEMLSKLEKLTGVKLNTIPVDSLEVLSLFVPDEDGNVTGCVQLPEFKSEYVRNIISILKPKKFDDLVKISAISHGTGAWAGNGEILAKDQGIGIKDIIATRDDIFEYNLSLGLDRNMAFEIAEAVRKGIVSRGKNAKWQNWKKELIEAGAPEWYIWSCEQIKYLFPRGHAISYVYMDMRLGWFQVHYPEEFNMVMKEYEEDV